MECQEKYQKKILLKIMNRDSNNSFEEMLSSDKSKSEETALEKILNNKEVSSKEIMAELKLEGFSQEEYNRSLEWNTTYSISNFVKPETFTRSFINYKIHFTNKVKAEDSPFILENIEYLKNNIAELLSKMEVVYKDTQNDYRLNKICNLYKWDLTEEVDPENHNLYKFEGKKKYLKNGKKTNPFRVFLGIDNPIKKNKKFYFLFLDPNHLAIPSTHGYVSNARNYSRETVKKNTFSQCQYNPYEIYQIIESRSLY